MAPAPPAVCGPLSVPPHRESLPATLAFAALLAGAGLAVRRAQPVLGAALVAGVSGWLLENVAFGTRYSRAFGGAPVPFLPVYALGGAAVAAVAPATAHWSPLARVALDTGTSTAVEFAVCKLERARGECSWSYGPDDACVDVEHSVVLGVLSSLLGEAVRRGL